MALAVTGRPFLDRFVFSTIVSLRGLCNPHYYSWIHSIHIVPYHFSSVMYGTSKDRQNRIALLQGTVLEGTQQTYKLNIHTETAF
jgi:hypothetical protein